VARDLGVQYVLEGSVQKSGDRLRVTAQLIDALSGHHIWSEVYNREMKDLFDMQDEITKKIVVSIGVEMGGGEEFRVFSRSTNNFEAWKHFVKGFMLFIKYTIADNKKAIEHFEAAIELDPEYVAAVAWLGWAHLMDAFTGGSDSPMISIMRSFELAQKALKLDEKEPEAYLVLAAIYLIQGEHEKMITEGRRAITLNPNFARGYAHLAGNMYYYGQFEESINLAKKAYRLDPKMHPMFLRDLARSYVFLECYEEALEVINQMEEHAKRGDLVQKEWPPLSYSWVYQELGREDEARAYMVEALKINPDLSLEYIKKSTLPYKNPAHLQRELDAYRKAGMPEKPLGAVP
jgi:adenylate cyclase